MGLFGRSDDVADLIAKRKYDKAVELLQAQLGDDAANVRLKNQLADVLAMAGKPLEAVPLLIEVADQYASQNEAPKAIAALKKIERIAPGRRDVEGRLATLIRDKKPRAAAGAGYQPKQGLAAEGYEPAGAVFDAQHFEQAAVVTDEQRIAAAKAATWQPDTRAPKAAEVEPVPVIEITPEPAATAPMTSFESQMQEAVRHAEATPAAEEGKGAAGSPLFSSFGQDELVAVMHGLRLLSFEPGDIIITEGDPGDSLFVLASGVAKAYVRKDGRQTFARRMEEGTFFGEISILSGKPRTATVTAATDCELLELDRATLDEITSSHPSVRAVLEDFYIQRASG
jgi:Cyclic nucleotide-binding domain